MSCFLGIELMNRILAVGDRTRTTDASKTNQFHNGDSKSAIAAIAAVADSSLKQARYMMMGTALYL